MAYKNVAVTVSDLLNPTACWILGAGASYDCNSTFPGSIPLASDLIPPEMVRGRLADELDRFITQGLISAANIEEALGGNTEATIDRIRALCLDPSGPIRDGAAYALKNLISLISGNLSMRQVSKWYENMGRDIGYAADNYIWLSSHACGNPGLSLITLNYDNVLDASFEIAQHMKLGVPRQYEAWENAIAALLSGLPVPRSDTGAFLKLHGSLGLYSCHNSMCKAYRLPIEPRRLYGTRPKGRVPGGDVAEMKCENCAQRLYEFILPPGHNKTEPEGAYFNFVYSEAKRALAEAPIWIVVGYSFPNHDIDMREILNDALMQRKRVVAGLHKMLIIDPKASDIADRIISAFPPVMEVVCINETFSGLARNLRKYSFSGETMFN